MHAGNVVEAVRHCRAVTGAIRTLQTMDDDELYVYAKVREIEGDCLFEVIALPCSALSPRLVISSVDVTSH